MNSEIMEGILYYQRDFLFLASIFISVNIFHSSEVRRCVLFSVGLSWEERIEILENEYFMDAKAELGEELKEMCNLSQRILEQGELKKAKETAGKLHSLGWNVGNIAKLLDYRPEQVREWLGTAVRS